MGSRIEIKSERCGKVSDRRKLWSKILSGSFLAIMAIHIIVFTAIGIFTPLGWRLLAIFGIGLAALACLWLILFLYSKTFAPLKWMLFVPFMRRALGFDDDK